MLGPVKTCYWKIFEHINLFYFCTKTGGVFGLVQATDSLVWPLKSAYSSEPDIAIMTTTSTVPLDRLYRELSDDASSYSFRGVSIIQELI
jgi:hypothetical protein